MLLILLRSSSFDKPGLQWGQFYCRNCIGILVQLTSKHPYNIMEGNPTNAQCMVQATMRVNLVHGSMGPFSLVKGVLSIGQDLKHRQQWSILDDLEEEIPISISFCTTKSQSSWRDKTFLGGIVRHSHSIHVERSKRFLNVFHGHLIHEFSLKEKKKKNGDSLCLRRASPAVLRM